MATHGAERPARPHLAPPSADDLFGTTEPVRSADDLARDGIFDDDELDDFLNDLYAMRRSEFA